METTFKHSSASEVTISELMSPSHSNFGGKIHGGYILSLMDSVAFACASKHSENYCVTASVDRVDFLMPIEVGELVTMKARVNYVGNSSMVVGIRVEAEDIRTGERKHCNSSYFTMVAKDASGASTRVPGLILSDRNEVRRFLRSIERMESRRQRSKRFHTDHFEFEKHAHLLEGHRVMLEV